MQYIIFFIAFISMFALPVLFHELGHFIFSKLAGIKVYEFSIGLPFIPRIYTFYKYKETEFTLKLIPIGGFISYAPTDKKEVESILEFMKYPGWRKLIGTLGGPIFNFLFAFLLVTIIMMNGVNVPSMEIENVLTNSASAQVGVQKNDKIISINGIKVSDWEELKDIINKNGNKSLKIQISRQDILKELELIPRFNPNSKEIQLGIIPLYVPKKYSFIEALNKSMKFIETVFKEFYLLIKKTLRGAGSVKDFSGPVGIAKTTNKAMNKGYNTYWLLVAFFSINLGLINLFPLPSLDGGQIIAYSIETVIGRTFELKTHQIFGVMGMFIIVLIMILVMYSDIITLWFTK